MPTTRHFCNTCGEGYAMGDGAFRCEAQGPPPEELPPGTVFEYSQDKSNPRFLVLVGYDKISPEGHLRVAQAREVHKDGGEYFPRWRAGVTYSGLVGRNGEEFVIPKDKAICQKEIRARKIWDVAQRVMELGNHPDLRVRLLLT